MQNVYSVEKKLKTDKLKYCYFEIPDLSDMYM